MLRSRTCVILGMIVVATCTVAPMPGKTRGQTLFAQHCAVCHGIDGDADTHAAKLLLPRPNAFGNGLFKLVSTRNGIPTDADLVSTLKRGMPGSTMMSWSWMPESDLLALAREVRRLSVHGRTAMIRDTARIANRPISDEVAMSQATRELVAGALVETGQPLTAPGESVLAEGERLYRQHCASCHGDDGRGLPHTRNWQSGDSWLWPRDFTSGYLRGGKSHDEIAYRIRAGMPGAHMPPTHLATAETEALVAFVRRMIPDGAGDWHAQWRRTVRATRLQELGSDLAGVEPVRLPAAPLRWRGDAIDELSLRTAHDGNELMIEVSWADATRDDRVRPDARMSDGIAIQFARSEDPPLFAMGSQAQPVNVWRWHAYDPKELAGVTDLLWQTPHTGLDVPVSIQIEPRAESLQLGGIGSVGRQAGSGLPLSVTTTWRDGRWRATFRRALAARDDQEVDLTATGPLLFAVAVWDGAIDKHPGSKSITTWHALDLQLDLQLDQQQQPK